VEVLDPMDREEGDGIRDHQGGPHLNNGIIKEGIIEDLLVTTGDHQTMVPPDHHRVAEMATGVDHRLTISVGADGTMALHRGKVDSTKVLLDLLEVVGTMVVVVGVIMGAGVVTKEEVLDLCHLHQGECPHQALVVAHLAGVDLEEGVVDGEVVLGVGAML